MKNKSKIFFAKLQNLILADIICLRKNIKNLNKKIFSNYNNSVA